jgi:hypothetical protein
MVLASTSTVDPVTPSWASGVTAASSEGAAAAVTTASSIAAAEGPTTGAGRPAANAATKFADPTVRIRWIEVSIKVRIWKCLFSYQKK